MKIKFRLTPAVRRFAEKNLGVDSNASDATVATACGKYAKRGPKAKAKMAALCERDDSRDSDRNRRAERRSKGPERTLARSKMGQVRVIPALERYDSSRTKAVMPETTGNGIPRKNAGAAVFSESGRALSHPSERDKAVIGSVFKWMIAGGSERRDIPRALRMTDHDKEIVKYALHELPWTGIIRGEGTEDQGAMKVENQKLTDFQRKGLLDDSTSGGTEAVPVVFDDAVILTPLLFGELYPDVNVVPVSRGRKIDGFSMLNPTMTWGTAEGTAITPFDTTGFVSAFDTTIYPVVGTMEIGLDFEEDAPNDIGGIVAMKFGESLMVQLDTVIANGDGVAQPLGIANSPGILSVVADNGTGGPPTVSDYEAIMLGISKAYKKDGKKVVFIANETSYRRAVGIEVGATDQRRVFGMNQNAYNILGADYRVTNSLGNSTILAGILKNYRMYRRLGFTARIETAGNYLASRNIKLVVCRGRFGGKPELAGAFAKIVNAQS